MSHELIEVNKHRLWTEAAWQCRTRHGVGIQALQYDWKGGNPEGVRQGQGWYISQRKDVLRHGGSAGLVESSLACVMQYAPVT